MIDDAGLEFIKNEEDCRLESYKDIAGVWTIGYGTTRYPNGEKVQRRQKITQDEADFYLSTVCDGICNKIDEFVRVKLSQNKFNALCSFCYNVGTPAFRYSTLLERINKRAEASLIRRAFMMWNKAHVDGKLVEVKGLSSRRKREADLYLING